MISSVMDTLVASLLFPSKKNGTLPIEKERPLMPKFERSPNDPFLQQLNASGKKWVIIIFGSTIIRAGRASFSA